MSLPHFSLFSPPPPPPPPWNFFSDISPLFKQRCQKKIPPSQIGATTLCKICQKKEESQLKYYQMVLYTIKNSLPVKDEGT